MLVRKLLPGDKMKKEWKTYALWIAIAEAVGALAGFLTREGTRLYADAVVKPPLSPPAQL